ncbi:hypothetical protein ITJ38_11060 [Agreia pratensis]|nr:hypothetical protein [Agreia pratensis]
MMSTSAQVNRPAVRPWGAAITSLVCGVIVAVVAIISLANAASDGALLGGGLVGAVVAVIAFLFAGQGFQFARSSSAKLPASGPLMLLSFVAVIIGVIGSMGAFVLSSALVSQNGVSVAIIVLVLSIVVTITGFRLVRVALQRSRRI